MWCWRGFILFWRIGIHDPFSRGSLRGVKVSDLLKEGTTWVTTCTKYSEASVLILTGTTLSFGSSNIVLECTILLFTLLLLVVLWCYLFFVSVPCVLRLSFDVSLNLPSF